MAKYFFKMEGLECPNEMMPSETKFNLEECIEQGCLIADKKKKEVNKKLDLYDPPENANDVDLSKVMCDWFPFGNYDIFLSHSHNDEKMAIAIAYYLQKHFQLKCFIDSCVWGYSESLLKKLDDKYCKKEGKLDYDSRNGTTAHVHLMLNSSLMKMMQSTPTFIFLQTEDSLQTERKGVENWTYSSWIYSELCMSRVMKDILYPVKKEGLSHGSQILLESAQLPMGYSNVTTNHLKDLSLERLQIEFNTFSDWKNSEEIFRQIYFGQ